MGRGGRPIGGRGRSRRGRGRVGGAEGDGPGMAVGGGEELGDDGDAAAGAGGGGAFQVDDRADAAADEAADDVEAGARRGQGHGFETGGHLLGSAGVEGRHETAVAGVGGLQHVQHLGTADLADDDAVGAHAEGVADQLAQRDLAPALNVGGPCLEPDDVGAGKPQLGEVLDGDHPFACRDGGGEDVEQPDVTGVRRAIGAGRR
jgi:hypothetical protein